MNHGKALIRRTDNNDEIPHTMNVCIFIAGDSTAANKEADKYPETGWGQVLHNYFSEAVTIRNYAKNGRSSKSFIHEGILKKIEAEINQNDFLFIQFGHNDEKESIDLHTDPQTDFKHYLAQYIECAREAKAFPVLLTPIQRRVFNAQGGIENTHGEYPLAMKELANALKVPVLDVSEASKKLFEAMGDEDSKCIFLWLKPGEEKFYPEGIQDNTHFCLHGSAAIVKLIIECITKENTLNDLIALLKPEHKNSNKKHR